MTGLLAIVIAYLLGAIPFGYLLVRLRTGRDVREEGSGNIGATNVLRSAGRAIGIATLILDAAKGYAAVWIAAELTKGPVGDTLTKSSFAGPIWTSAAALAVMIGHVFPVFLRFKGGKAVATFIGAFLFLTPLPLLAAMLVFLVVVAVTRYISAGSVLAAATFPLAVWLIDHPAPVVVLTSAIAGALIVYRHQSNLERLHSGSEAAFTWKRQ